MKNVSREVIENVSKLTIKDKKVIENQLNKIKESLLFKDNKSCISG